jgi:hypothetical protein
LEDKKMTERKSTESGVQKLNNFNGSLSTIIKLISPVFMIGALIISIGLSVSQTMANARELEEQKHCIESILEDMSDLQIQLAGQMAELKVEVVWIKESVKDISEQLNEES